MNSGQSHLMSSYRGYNFSAVNKETGQRTCCFVFKEVNPHLPRKFYWTGGIDVVNLHRYIDALLLPDAVEAKKYEEMGLAVGHKFIEATPTKYIDVSKEMLISILLGEMPFRVPINSVLRFRRNNRVYTATEMHAALADAGLVDRYHAAVMDFVRTGRPISLDKRGLDLEPQEGLHAKAIANASPDIALVDAEQQQRGVALEQPDDGVPIHTLVFEEPLPDGRIERIMVVDTPNEKSYYIRQIIKDGVPVYNATAWTVDGPWHHEEDAA